MVKKFTSRMDRAIRIKDLEEKACQEKLAQALAEKNKREACLNVLKQAQRQMKDEYRSLLSSSLRIRDVMSYNIYLNELRRDIGRQEAKIQDAISLYNDIRELLGQISRTKLVYEKFREKEFELFREAQKKEEQQLNDEFAALLFTRSQK